jgi:hypothetical protein
MKTMVYGEKTASRDALLHRLFNAAEQIREKPDVLGRTIDLLIHGPQKCIDAEGTLFELSHQQNWTTDRNSINLNCIML